MYHVLIIKPTFSFKVRVRVTLQLTTGQSVRLGIKSLWDSRPNFGCSQDSCGFVCLI